MLDGGADVLMMEVGYVYKHHRGGNIKLNKA